MALYKRRLPDGTRTPTWYYDFVKHGRRYKGCTDQHDKVKAREFEDDLKARVRLGQPLEGPKEVILPTFEEYASAYLAGDGALKRTVKDDKSILDRALTPFFGKRRLNEIERSDVERFRNERMSGRLFDEDRNLIKELKPATVERELALLKRILNIAVQSGLLVRNPVAGVRLPRYSNRRERVIDTEEYARLLLAVSKQKGSHLRPMMILAYETGMREGEILGLKWADVDFRHHQARLPRTKNGEARSVPLSERAEAALRDWGRKNETFVFPPLTEKRQHLGKVSHAFKRLAERAEVREVRFHDFRHTFCTRMVERGADLITLAEITGHKSLAMLKRYSHPSDARKLALVRGAGEEATQRRTERRKAQARRGEIGGNRDQRLTVSAPA